MLREIILMAATLALWPVPPVLAAEQATTAEASQADETWNKIKGYSVGKRARRSLTARS